MPRRPRTLQACLGRCQGMPRTLRSMPRRPRTLPSKPRSCQASLHILGSHSNIYIFIYFCLLILLMHIFFALPPPFLEQPSIQRCTSCCKPCDHLENAGFETYNPRRSWHAIVLFETHRDARAFISLSRLVRGPRQSYGCT